MSKYPFRVFTRAWWTRDESGALVPNSNGRKTTIGRAMTENIARGIARAWNANHEPGEYEVRAEFEEIVKQKKVRP